MSRLVITRRCGERFRIGSDIWVEVVKIDRGKVQIATTAPAEVRVMREELLAQNNIATDIAGTTANNNP